MHVVHLLVPPTAFPGNVSSALLAVDADILGVCRVECAPMDKLAPQWCSARSSYAGLYYAWGIWLVVEYNRPRLGLGRSWGALADWQRVR